MSTIIPKLKTLYANSIPFLFKQLLSRKKFATVGGAICIVLGVLFILGLTKFAQIQTKIEAGKQFRLPPSSVTSIITQEEEWIPTLNAVGNLQAVHGVTVSADLPGIVENIHIVSGTEVRQGDLLVKLDTRQEEARLIAAKARQELAGYNLKRAQELYGKNVSARSEYDAAVATFQENLGNVKEIETQIARKTIRAPFSGLLGIRQVDVGQYLQSGDKIVPLQSLNPIYVNFSLPQSDLAQLQKSKQVLIHTEGGSCHSYEGTITALNAIVDRSTANIKAQATLPNKDDLLRPGMFVRVEVRLPDAQKVITVPASAISYTLYGDSVFVIQSTKGEGETSFLGVEQRFVKLGATRGDRVIIESGLKLGEEVATSQIFSLRSGSPVRVHNEIQPSNQLAPQPEDS